jgi:hypothetical protein
MSGLDLTGLWVFFLVAIVQLYLQMAPSRVFGAHHNLIVGEPAAIEFRGVIAVSVGSARLLLESARNRTRKCYQ